MTAPRLVGRVLLVALLAACGRATRWKEEGDTQGGFIIDRYSTADDGQWRWTTRLDIRHAQARRLDKDVKEHGDEPRVVDTDWSLTGPSGTHTFHTEVRVGKDTLDFGGVTYRPGQGKVITIELRPDGTIGAVTQSPDAKPR